MSTPPDDATPHRVDNLSSLCPVCGQLCIWYRVPTLLYAVCPLHGRVEEAAIRDLGTPPPSDDEPPVGTDQTLPGAR